MASPHNSPSQAAFRLNLVYPILIPIEIMGMFVRPFALTISIRPQPDPVSDSCGSGTIIAGTNPRGAPSRPARYALRHENKS